MNWINTLYIIFLSVGVSIALWCVYLSLLRRLPRTPNYIHKTLRKDLNNLVRYVGADKALLVQTIASFEQDYTIIESDTLTKDTNSMFQDINAVKILVHSKELAECPYKYADGFKMYSAAHGNLQTIMGDVKHENAHVFSLRRNGLYLILFFPFTKQYSPVYVDGIHNSIKRISNKFF